MVLNDAQVLIAKFLGKHVEECREAFGLKSGAMLVREAPKLPERAHKQLEDLDGSMQQPLGVSVGTPPPDALLLFNCFHGKGVHLSDKGRALQAIGKDVLAIEDCLLFMEARQDCLLHYLAQELVPGGHRSEQRVQLQIL